MPDTDNIYRVCSSSINTQCSCELFFCNMFGSAKDWRVCVHTHAHKTIHLFCQLNCMYRCLMRSTFWWKWMTGDRRIVQGDLLCVMSLAPVFSLCSGVWRMVYTLAPLLVCTHSFLNCLWGTFPGNEIYQVELPLSFVLLSLHAPAYP